MSGQSAALSNDELHAYVDGVLEPTERLRVEAYLAAHPEAAGQVRDYVRLNEGLRALGASLESSPHAVTIKSRRPASALRVLRVMPWAAAVAGLLALGGIGGWLAHGRFAPYPRAELSHLSAVAYQLYTAQEKHPVEVWASDRDHLQTWLTKCLKAPMVAPELAQEGYSLLGGRLLSNVQGAAALLIYQGKDNQRIGLYIANLSDWGQGKPSFEEVGALGTFTWIKGPFWYSLAGKLKAEDLKAMAREVNQQVVNTAL